MAGHAPCGLTLQSRVAPYCTIVESDCPGGLACPLPISPLGPLGSRMPIFEVQAAKVQPCQWQALAWFGFGWHTLAGAGAGRWCSLFFRGVRYSKLRRRQAAGGRQGTKGRALNTSVLYCTVLYSLLLSSPLLSPPLPSPPFLPDSSVRLPRLH